MTERNPMRAALPEIAERRIGDVVVLAVSGNLDMAAAPKLADHVGAVLKQRPPVIVADLTDVNFLATAGMTVLLEAQRRCEELSLRFAVVGSGPITARPLQLLGVDEILDLFPSVDAALRGPDGDGDTRGGRDTAR